MHFNGPLIGGRLGVAVRSPYLDPAVVAYALTLGGSDLVVEHDGPGGRRGFDWRSGSSGRIRTYNPPVNSRMLYP
jgi:hypothetical protein